MYEIIKFFGIVTIGTTAIVSGVIYISKVIFNKSVDAFLESHKLNLNKELENHKSELSRETERFKLELNKLQIQHQIKFTKLYEERAQVIKDIFGKVFDLQIKLENLTTIAQGPDWTTDTQREDNALRTLTEFRVYFEKNQIFFEYRICDKVQLILKNSLDVIQGMRSAKNRQTMNDKMFHVGQFPSDDRLDYPTQKWDEMNQKVTKDLNDMRLEIAKEFRHLMGIDTDE